MAYIYGLTPGLGAGLNLTDLDLQKAISDAKSEFDKLTHGGGGGQQSAPAPKPMDKSIIPGVPDVALLGAAAVGGYFLFMKKKS